MTDIPRGGVEPVALVFQGPVGDAGNVMLNVAVKSRTTAFKDRRSGKRIQMRQRNPTVRKVRRSSMCGKETQRSPPFVESLWSGVTFGVLQFMVSVRVKFVYRGIDLRYEPMSFLFYLPKDNIRVRNVSIKYSHPVTFTPSLHNAFFLH